MKATGTLLKEAREKQNLSISEVSMSTKINPKVISAIEEGNEGKLPAKTFLKGFVRSYAIYLKLDVETVMTSLQQDLGEKQETAAQAAATAAAASKKEEVESPTISANPRILKGLAVGGVLFLIVMIVTVKSLVEKYEKEKALDPAVQVEMMPEEKPPVDAADEEAKTAEEVKPTEEEAPTESASAAEAAVPAVVAEPAAVTATTPATPTEAAPAPEKAKNVEVAKPVEVKPTPAVASATPPPPAKPEVKVEPPKPIEVKAETKPVETAAAALKDNEIILEALDKVDITFVVNNGPTTRLSLQPAQVHTIKAKGQVAMDVSDGGAVNVIHNGQDNGTLGDLGKPKKVRYP